MPVENVDGLDIAYEVIGAGEPWATTPGGRYSKDVEGVSQLARALADTGKRVLIWDRPNTGASDVCFEGDSESAMQADVLAGLLHRLDMTPAVIIGGSGGSRVSLLAAARHPEAARGVALWWISGGPYGLISLGVHYCGDSIVAAWRAGMEAVVALPVWREVIEANPANRAKLLAQDRQQFIETLERWMIAYCPHPDELVPGLPDEVARSLDVPALVFRSGTTDAHHTRQMSEQVAGLLPRARLAEPPWGDSEWNERMAAISTEGLFSRWPLLVPQLVEWGKSI